MSKPSLSFVLFFFLNLGSLSTIAQSNHESPQDSVAVMLWLSKSFIFSKPDTGFVSMVQNNGYAHSGMNASIKYLTFPQKYDKIKSQYKDHNPTESTLFIDSIIHRSRDHQAFTIIQEQLSPDKNLYENYITLITIIDFGEITVCVVGAYPKSKDNLLREKFIDAALSIKEEL